jgi:3-oxoacyl-[acyl-carrier-protein] synthase-3
MTAPKAAIRGVGHYLPEYRLTNSELEGMVETNDEWIRDRTGISERRILKDPEKASAFMAEQAVNELLKRSGLAATEVDLIICATVTPDYTFPATANLVAKSCGLNNSWGYDINAACSGFLYALTTGAQFIESGRHKNVIVVGVDTMSRIIDYTDRTTCIIFGDGAGAVLLQADTDGNGLYNYTHAVDGAGVDHLLMPAGGSRNPATAETVAQRKHYARQDGKVVFKHAVSGMANAAVSIMEKSGLKPDDIRYLVPHQANKRIIDVTANRMGIPEERVMINIHKYGNTTAATIPLCLYDYESKLKKGDNLVLAAFGGGFTWGAIHLKWAYSK